MASSPRHLFLLLPLRLLLLIPLLAAAKPVLEDGYTVTTFANFNPLPASGPHPYAILPRPRAGDLLLLDSAGSALYTLSLSSSPGEPRRLAGGKRRSGFDDGDAAFDRPRSVAVDAADNVYVADQRHGAVRKVAPSGYTTTVAGGLSSGPGHRDGLAQNATFSADFELVYVPKICALLVADRGNRMVRQINLKPEDCAHEKQSGLGTTSVSVIAILCALLGLIIGFLVRHFYPVNEVSINHFFIRIQKQFLRTQRKATLISFCDIKSAVASSAAYTLLLRLIRFGCGYITVVFPSVRLQQEVPLRPCRRRPVLRKTSTAPNIGLNNKAPLPPTGLLEDLISFAGDAGDNEGSGNANSQEGKVSSYEGDLMGLLYTPPDSVKKIDHMIETNLSGFSSHVNRCRLTVSGCSVSRRVHGD
ncbi:hypothetical protein BDA96_07G134700 [Sorghum bicolor]|uniref:Strictosidine synthase conserved region domain-containing protein n=2 Tax=Sorghum bicolor TaxID=4558 RepID=A0A921QKJ3_SORBI|nr:uncharacterized protein LOC8073549 isoform X1 [Sorghum bicolor]EES13823.1 hypothetical protein SORBI_3007G125700 [Sorghum bicolor]KAG0523578.1 hypothetical protein BDA96_07G134700 [Sorghum bicolor]|eukprot:XP_002444328.1 uncharacterized protein LOC8073549 isoform X1 [Sorghum bicolor]